MDGELLCYTFGIYKEKYYTSHEPAEDTTWDTDRKDTPIQLLNDYVGGQLKDEEIKYDETQTLKVVKVCSAIHSGNKENPKTVTLSIANIVEKWDFCDRKLEGNKEILEENEAENTENPPTLISNECVCFEKPPLAEDAALTRSSFVDTIIECTEKIVLHGQKLGKVLMQKGEAKKMCILAASLKMILNRVTHYKEVHGKGVKKDFMEKDLEDMIQASMIQVIEYFNDTIGSTTLHDGESNDWLNQQPFAEGQRISTSIQFWAFMIQGLRADFFNILPETLAKKAISNILKRSLDVLTARYSQIKPSSRRLPQYRADISVVLFIAHDILLSITPDVRSLFHPAPKNGRIKAIHHKCLLLMTALVVVGCPVKAIERHIQSIQAPEAGAPKRLDPLDKSDNEKLTCWLFLSFPGIYSHVPERLNTPAFIFLLGRIAAVQPQPHYPIITRLCLAKDMEFPSLIMKNFGAFAPGMRGENMAPRGLARPCAHLLCNKRCISVADIHWPARVGSSVLYVVMHGNPDKEALVKVLSPLLGRLSPGAWAVLNKNVMWSPKKPVWFQGLIDLLEPYIQPCVDDLMDDVESGKSWTLAHVPESIMRLLKDMTMIAELVPESFFAVCDYIKTLVPEDVTLTCDSVLVHMFVSCAYSLIMKIVPVFRQWKMQIEKVDFLVALGEKLCNLDPTEDTKAIQDKATSVFKENGTAWDEIPEDYATVASEVAADKILTEPHGQESLKTIHRFLAYNSEWLQKTLGVNPRGGDSLTEKSANAEPSTEDQPKLVPWQDDAFRIPSPKEMVAHCCFLRYNSLLTNNPVWDDCIRLMMTDMNPMLIRQLMRNRPEINDMDSVDESDKSAHSSVSSYINDHLLEKVDQDA